MEPLSLLKKYIKNPKVIFHSLLVAEIMKELASFLNEDKDLYYLTGLYHDLDYELTKENIKEHGIISAKILEEYKNFPEELLYAIKAHNYENTHIIPKSKLDICLIASDNLAGLIIATSLVMPNKKISEIKLKSLKKKFKQKSFASNINRNKILVIEKIGLPLEKFFELALNAAKRIEEKFTYLNI